MSEELAPGTSLPGGYIIEAPLDAGRITTRYRARSADGAAACAHVVHLALSDLMGEWFTQTAILHRGLEHPVLPRTHAVGELDGPRPVEVTELLLGRPARAYLNASPDGLDPRWVAGVIAELASALDYLHEQRPPLLHRALSPERVLILDDTREVRLLGVGVADRPQFPAVRPSYQSPEELAGITGLTARADVFGLATLAWELLTGRPAFTGAGGAVLDAMRVGVHDRVSVLRPTVPASVDAVLRDAWALSPDQRPRTAGRFAELLAAAVAEGAQEPVSPQVAGMFDDRPTAETPVLILSGRSQTLIGAGAAVRASEPVVASPAAATKEAPAPEAAREAPAAADAAPLTTASPPEPAPESASVAPDPSENVTEVVPKRAVADLEKTAPLTPLPTSSDAPSPAVSPRSARPAPAGGRLARGRATPTLHIPSPEEVAAAPAPVNTSLDAAERTTPLGAPPAPSTEVPVSNAIPDAKPQRPSVPSIVVAPEAEQPSRQPAPAPVAPAPAPSQPAPQMLAPAPSQPAPVAPDPFAAPPYASAPPHAAPSAPPLGAGLASEFGARERPTLPLMDDPPAPEKRSSFPLGAALIANAILLVGIAHAIAWGVSSRQPPQTVTVTQPAPACAPCAACPAPAAIAAPEPEEPAPPSRHATASRANPSPAAPTVQRLQPVGRSQSARGPRRSRIIVNPPSF